MLSHIDISETSHRRDDNYLKGFCLVKKKSGLLET